MRRRSSRAAAIAALACATLAAGAARAQAQEARVSAGLTARVLSGHFGSGGTTRVLYVPASLRIDARRVEVSLSFGYLSVRNGTVAPSAGGLIPMQGSLGGRPGAGLSMGGRMMGGGAAGPIGEASGAAAASFVTDASGVSDVFATAGYRVLDDRISGLQILIAGTLKLPSASAARGLGTGRPDAGGIVGLRKPFTNGWMSVEGGYLFVGSPGDTDLANAVLWALGGGYRVTDRVFLLASASGNSAVVPGFAAPAEAGAGVGLRLRQGAYLTAIPTFGLSDASPRYAMTVGVTSDLQRR